MLAPNVHIEGFDAASWTRLVDLFRSDAPHTRPCVVVVDNERRIVARNINHPLLAAGSSAPVDLAQVASMTGSAFVAVVKRGAPRRMASELATRLEPGRSYLTQLLLSWRVVREARERGDVELWPNPARTAPIPTEFAAAKGFDFLLPEGKTALLTLWEGELHTALAVRRSKQGLDAVIGPEILLDWTGPLGGDFRRDYRVLADAVERHLGPVHLGVFTSASKLRMLLRAARPGAWAQEVAVRNVIVHPMPGAFRAAIGADALRGIGKVSSELFLSQQTGEHVGRALAPVFQILREHVLQTTNVTALLGFDPADLLSSLLRRTDDR